MAANQIPKVFKVTLTVLDV